MPEVHGARPFKGRMCLVDSGADAVSGRPTQEGSRGRPGSDFGAMAPLPLRQRCKPQRHHTVSYSTRASASATPSRAIGSTSASVAERITAWKTAQRPSSLPLPPHRGARSCTELTSTVTVRSSYYSSVAAAVLLFYSRYYDAKYCTCSTHACLGI